MSICHRLVVAGVLAFVATLQSSCVTDCPTGDCNDLSEKVSKPTFSPQAGSFAAPIDLQISCSTGGTTIRYTTDGSEPTSNSRQYSGPLYIGTSTTIKARAFKSGSSNSDVASANFVINMDESKVKLQKQTRLITSDSPLKIKSISTNSLTFSYSGNPPAVAVGDVLVATSGQPYLRRVTSVSNQSGVLTVATEDAALTDAFQELHLSEAITLADNRSIPGTAKVGAGRTASVTLAGWKFAGSQTAAVDARVDRIDFDIAPEIQVAIDLSAGQLRYFRGVVGGTTTLEVDASFTTSHASSLAVERSALGQPIDILPGTWVPVFGPISVHVGADFDLLLGASGELERQGTLAAGFEATYTLLAGVKYESGQWSKVSEFTPTFTPWISPLSEPNLSSEIKFYVRPKVRVLLYGFVGPYADARPYYKLTGFEQASDPYWELGRGITGNVGIDFTAEKFFKLIGLKGYSAGYSVNFQLIDSYSSLAKFHHPSVTELAATATPPAPGSGSRTVKVSCVAKDGDGSIASVAANLSALGGSNSVALAKKGTTNNWEWTGNLTFTGSLSGKQINVTAKDNQGRILSLIVSPSETGGVCGDGVCQPNETKQGCPQDCDIAEVFSTITTTTARIEVFARDTAQEDGDRIDILLNGVVVRSNLTLTNAGESVFLTLSPGNNTVDIKALNTGWSGPNTAGFVVYDANDNILLSESWSMQTGQISRLLVIYVP